MKEVELNELEPEKQPMNAASGAAMAVVGAEKNGLVKIKVAEDEAEAAAAAKFTGLSKEELLKVAGSPGWVRTRWVLLLLFWLGWLGMLAGAVVIIVRAPRCRELPAQKWWHTGALYRIGDLQAFQGHGSGNLAGECSAPPPWVPRVESVGLHRPRPLSPDDLDGSPLHPVPTTVPSSPTPSPAHCPSLLSLKKADPPLTLSRGWVTQRPPSPRRQKPVATGFSSNVQESLHQLL